MNRKRQLILSVTIMVALSLTFALAQAVDWNNVETWSFSLSSRGWNIVESWNFRINKGWNNVETCSFNLANETHLWNHVDDATVITAPGSWSPILAFVLILLFAVTLLIIYTKRKHKK